ATVAARTVGNPVRQELFEIEPAQPHQPLRLLVLGGSLGAQRLNELMPIVAKELVTAGKLEIVHQSGARNLQATLEGYQQQGVAVDASQGVRVVPYLQQIDEVYRWADLVLCRSGAMTVSELAMVGRPSILIPFPFAVDDHQTANGAFLQQQGAAEMVQQRELSSDQLIQRVNQFIEQPDRIEQMGRAAKAAAEPEATRQVKEICKMLCRE
ncbi:MAG TPA: UDP-N-acetylglucosamine--N-acetylmuramyl-(pentapeptide) pyrophosphoryl-undecaprenol N-acetylglucosamine transferase, partial [Gammaproteobacteria bacterium]|nr:UDP-N-acetylglucosamine--N-acetylmuramyl-(pentapeptide) pyrophosphoryl-undecaprenol N-acetylglucosamine transferase [Gammaproteobacteria bacterium]